VENNFFVSDLEKRYQVDLRERLLKFAVLTIKFVGTLPDKKEYHVFKYQLSKSVTSIGANYEEAQGAYSKADFEAKIGICLKEARETNYFLTVLNELILSGELNHLLKESEEIKKMFGSALVKMRKKRSTP